MFMWAPGTPGAAKERRIMAWMPGSDKADAVREEYLRSDERASGQEADPSLLPVTVTRSTLLSLHSSPCDLRAKLLDRMQYEDA